MNGAKWLLYALLWIADPMPIAFGGNSIHQQATNHTFTSTRIDDTLFKRIYGKSYKENCTVPKEDLRYLRISHYNFNGEIRLGELICHKDISKDLLEIFQTLFQAKYPIEKMVLIDDYEADDEKSMQDNNTSCFNFRFVAGTSKLSGHSEGYAVDINPRYNPYIKQKGERIICKPQNSIKYTNRASDFPYKITREDLCYKEFKKRGFEWGGDWKSLKDYQHFEKKR